MKDTAFYNAESSRYSGKRYPSLARTFTQHFFKERLRLTLILLTKYLPAQKNIDALEIGCADGVVARAVWEAFPGAFTKFDAVDLASQMIEVAKQTNADIPVHFLVREGSTLPGTYACIIEIGVLNYLALEEELNAVSRALQPRGVYICSISGSSSVQTALKGADDFMHLRSYAQYEEAFAKHFNTLRVVPVGFFVPLLWKVPASARVLQPLIERALLSLVPNWAHEKIYVLTPKS